MPKVGLSTGVERREILRKAAYYIRSETAKQISSKLIIMPRMSPPGADMTRTRGDAIRGVLEELINFHDDEIKYFEFEEIIICGNPDIMEGMDQFSFAENLKSLPIHMENLYEKGPWAEIEIQDVNGEPTTIRVNEQIKKSKFRMSISVPSSDPAFGIYGALQNMIFAVHPADRALLQGVPEEVLLSDERAESVSASTLLPDTVRKRKHHPDRYNISYEALKNDVSEHREADSDISLQYRTLYRNLARLAEHVMPDLAYVDGTYVVDGLDARIDGGFGLSGDDPVAVDTVLAEILGMDVSTLGHLQYMQDQHLGCADPDDISVAMGSPDDLNIEFTPHPDEQQRLDWRHVRLPDENGEAVGYIPPEDEAESESEHEEETGESEPADTGQKDEESVSTSDESDEEAEGTAEAVDEQEAESDTEADAGTESKPADEVEASDEDLSLRERIERRLIRRGKMEGDLPEGEQRTEPKETSDAEQEASGQEEEPDEEVPEEGAEPEEEPAEESEEEVSQTEEEEEKGEEPEAASTQAEPKAPEDAPDDVRERIRRRLIRRGKLEGELPDEEVEATSDEAEEQEQTESEETDEQKGGKTEEDTGEDTDTQEDTEQDEDGSSSVRDRVQQRLANRDKLDAEPEEESEGEEETASGEALKKGGPDQVDEVDETVEVTTSSGPSLRPSDEVTDTADFLANLSDYEPEDKIRRRLAVRQQAVGGSTGGDQAPVEEEKDQEESGPDTGEQTDGEDDQGAPEEKKDEASEDESEEADQEDEGGYSRDPDAPLRDRVKERLAQRGKLE